jgi:hypothetical protein
MTVTGTSDIWHPPEQLATGQSYGLDVDIFALGRVTAAMLSGGNAVILESEYLDHIEQEHAARDFVRGCQASAGSRFSAVDACSHPWMNGTTWQDSVETESQGEAKETASAIASAVVPVDGVGLEAIIQFHDYREKKLIKLMKAEKHSCVQSKSPSNLFGTLFTADEVNVRHTKEFQEARTHFEYNLLMYNHGDTAASELNNMLPASYDRLIGFVKNIHSDGNYAKALCLKVLELYVFNCVRLPRDPSYSRKPSWCVEKIKEYIKKMQDLKGIGCRLPLTDVLCDISISYAEYRLVLFCVDEKCNMDNKEGIELIKQKFIQLKHLKQNAVAGDSTQLQQRLQKKEYVVLNSLWDLKIKFQENMSVEFFEEAKKDLSLILEYRKCVQNIRHIVQSSKNLAKLLLNHEKYGVARNDKIYQQGLSLINDAIRIQTDDKGPDDQYMRKHLCPLRLNFMEQLSLQVPQGSQGETKNDVDVDVDDRPKKKRKI